ncbi:uncharacterized protein PGTG_05461 [Puccinia graminis f. sp. tritici CRL 75-36-700-3]|uniref:Uncharacterized protein n=1 Tax=Puccinia graminis f. sp. tritici (strain CRL 75-36-700-3 / race SCCL) TaxID=418459 RepID=E3K4F4_PUCGT|nr:uncharacterized protein PGTG_05461 [Puccinia graminis f. sp. tritici CRL 75-36-700-3]EFP79140.2 hypothetical protein PGTG_05461 [Puccinia graminis f. sp. tritici CRL 75-36-700-3]
MTQRRSRRLFSQTENSYESRIQYLEEVVHILVAGSNSTCFPLFSTTPLASSFRYSIKRGLEPVLPDKTAISLAADWRIGRPIRQKFFSSPPRRQNRLITTCDTSLHPARVPSPTPPTSLTNPASPTTFGVANSANTAKSSLTSDLANKPTGFSPLDSPYSPLASVRLLDERPADTTSFLPEEALSPSPTPPYSPSTYPSITQTPSPDSARSSSPAPPQLTPTTPSDPPPHCQKRPIDIQRASALSISSSSPALPPLRSSTTPTNSALSSSRLPLHDCMKSTKAEDTSVTCSPASKISKSVSPAPLPLRSTTPSTPLATLYPLNSKINLHSATDSSPLTSTSDSMETLALLMPSEAHASHAITLTQRSNSANVAEPNDFLTLDNTPATPTAIIDVNPDPTTDTATTSAASSPHDHQLTSIPVTDGTIGPTSLSSLKLINNNDNQDNFLPTTNLAQSLTDTIDDTTTPLPVTSPVNPTLPLPDCSTPICPTAPACPAKLEIAGIGSLTVENDDSNSTDAQLAPEYSRTTLEYYNDIDNYLKLSGVNETKKKKKKKKKTTNSGSNSSTTSSAQPSDTLNTPEHLLPSLPVDVPAAALGALR